MAKKDDLNPEDYKKVKRSNVTKPSKFKQQYEEFTRTCHLVYDGASHLVLALSIVIVAFYHIYDLLNRPVDNFEFYTRSVASVIIACVGAWAVVKVFKAIGEKK